MKPVKTWHRHDQFLEDHVRLQRGDLLAHLLPSGVGHQPLIRVGRRVALDQLLEPHSWIVNPFEDGGVVLAIEITMGAAIAGPFDIQKSALAAMIGRVLARPAAAPSASMH